MKLQMVKKILMGFCVVTLFAACKKGAGEGGRAFIKGKVYIKNYTAPPGPFILQDEYYAQGENVFIVYGDEPGVGKNVKTSFDGSFQFEYLRKGKYKVFALSDDTSSTINSKTKEIIANVEIKNATETINIPEPIMPPTTRAVVVNRPSVATRPLLLDIETEDIIISVVRTKITDYSYLRFT